MDSIIFVKNKNNTIINTIYKIPYKKSDLFITLFFVILQAYNCASR